ncbi:MAG: sulfotransferase domain-containing protein [Nocardioidaceae bacterium]|nr:sulfotransferase domain-containing protein [Nocardioidaceae bacterium]
MTAASRRYVSPDEDSGRWLGFPFRTGDVIVSTRSKSGTTWMQMICLLLVFGSPELPEPLGRLSPWLDHLIEPRDRLFERLEQQNWRRVMKTHTPLDGIPIVPGADYVVVARHPLDMAVSLYHQGDNIDRRRLAALTGERAPSSSAADRPSAHDWLMSWIRTHADPLDAMDSLDGVMWHLSDAWRRRHEPNVSLVHYDDLLADLEGEMHRLADHLGIVIEDRVWPVLVRSAGFEQMRARADQLVPNAGGILKDGRAFFRSGRSGAGREMLSDAEVTEYYRRVEGLAPPGLLTWLHR